MERFMKINSKYIITLLLFCGIVFIFAGCGENLQGDRFPNQIPIVNFVNIPPDGQEFSRNPEIYWVGTDNDGQIDYYRYYTAMEVDITTDPMIFIHTVDDSMWIYIDVEPTASDPRTTNIIPLRADSANPVNNFISQYIFLQAFDDRGAGSEIVYKILNRNDNPPETRILSIAGMIPFVNSIFEGGIITGVKLNWEGSDRRDYEEIGLIPPPFEYEWAFYGPFTYDDTLTIKNDYTKSVFVTEDARIFDVGDTLVRCDTTLNNDGSTDISCDTTVFEITTPNSPFFVKDTLLDINNTFFESKLVTNSSIENGGGDSWISAMGDTIYNVYRHGAPDTTVEQMFLFWVRSRDDAFVADLTPEFVKFPVINPRYERNILVIDFSSSGSPWGKLSSTDTAKAFWYNTINEWYEFAGFEEEDRIFDTLISMPTRNSSPDYLIHPMFSSGIPIAILLKHKIMILFNESLEKSGFIFAGRVNNPEILQAIDAGVNVWANWRVPIDGGLTGFEGVVDINAPTLYRRYFGVESTVYSSWARHALGMIVNLSAVRIEDFIGTYTLNEAAWPSLEVDPTLLRNRISWFAPIFWVDSIAAVPEVNWCERSFGTEVMYLYKSLYGSNHPLGFDYSFDGAPVGHRLRTSLFKTVHFNFSMIYIDSVQSQDIANNVLGWLYPQDLEAGGADAVKENRYENAPIHISIDEAREVHELRSKEASSD